MRTRSLVAILIAVLSLSVIESSNLEAKEGQANPMVLVKTSMGNFTVELYQKEAPATVENFLNYVDKKFYGGTIFHRVIDGFMIQGGGFMADMTQKPAGAPIKNEAANGLKNLKYTVAMARTQIVDSATCQFFINVKDNSSLDHRDKTQAGYGYCVFGKVVEGTDVIDKIKAVETTTKGTSKDVPVKPVMIKAITRIAAGAAEK